MILCKAICKNKKECIYKAKKDGYCMIHYKSELPECSICLSNNKNNNIILSCNHAFHINCLTPWLSKGHYTCPLCRKEILPEILNKYDIKVDISAKYLLDAELKLFTETFENEDMHNRLVKCYAYIVAFTLQEINLRSNIILYVKKKIKDPDVYVNELQTDINKMKTNNLGLLLPTVNNPIDKCCEYLREITIMMDSLLEWNSI